MSKDLLSIVAIAKNEADYILEWIEYHRLAGVDRIYLYDNDSDDNLKNIILPYIESGYIVYNFLPGKGKQLTAYNDALRKYGKKTKYMAFIDCDEFIVSKTEKELGKLVDTLIGKDNNFFVSGLAVNWCVFGSSGHESKPDGLVIENYLYHANYKNGQGNNCVKTIVKPRRVFLYIHPHYPLYLPFFHSIYEDGRCVKGWSNTQYNYKCIQINHYFTKSKEEWVKRRAIGKADHRDGEKRTLKEFYEHDNNDIYDDSLLPFAELIKKNLMKQGI